MRKEELPVLSAEARCEDAEEEEDAAQEEREAEESVIRCAAREGADEEEQEDLRGADPGYRGGRVVERADVVGLEDAEGVYIAPYVEDDEVAHNGLGPGS